ncbi:MAG: T9SS type A sorting domain-containing protein, partial [Bacteroidales bacterium]|nr:T9SS type A sorting domain-containing protein [Bacteroidales bacterium]
VYNTSGQLIYSTRSLHNTGTHTLQWNGLSNTGASIEAGYYLVQVIAGNTSSVQKLIMTD